MDKIQLLPDSVANQIAAGEVIQRPASVIKELMENSVDAGATQISVLVVDAGKTSIQVVDNGSGMSVTDARLAFERHATSKIRKAEDLFSLHTMGFRGEALPSIASVAQVTLKTRRADDTVGTTLRIEGGKLTGQEAELCQCGCNFLVENLFYNVPVRRRFLKANSTELNNIVAAFQRIALVYPEIGFSLSSNGQEMYNLKPTNTRKRIVEIFGMKLNPMLLPLEVETSLGKIWGYVGKPESSHKKNVHQYFFVNGRFMKHAGFHKAVQSAYERLIPQGEQVPYFIYFSVNPQDIDVNIHPTKTEIKFQDESAVWQILAAGVKEAVGKFNTITAIDFDTEDKPEIPVFDGTERIVVPNINFNPQYNPFNVTETEKRSGSNAPSNSSSGTEIGGSMSSTEIGGSMSNIEAGSNTPGFETPDRTPDFETSDITLGREIPSSTKSGTGGHSRESGGTDFVFDFGGGSVRNGDSSTSFRESSLNFEKKNVPNNWERLYEGLHDIPTQSNEPDSPLLDKQKLSRSTEHFQYKGAYILTSVEAGLMVTDQERAHERILFERYLREIRLKNRASQRLLFPETVQFTVAEMMSLPVILPEMEKLGFELTNLGGGTYAINAAPVDFEGLDISRLVSDMVSEASEQESSVSNELFSSLAATMARNAAIPHGQLLSNEEMEQIISQLLECDNSRYTPNGKLISSILPHSAVISNL